MTAQDTPPSSFICYMIAGEVSGDRLGAGIMHELKQMHPNIRFYGVGGPLMQAQGMESLFAYNELAVMGFVEILPKALHLLSRIDQAVDHIELKHPDMVVTIDSPGFNFRVVSKARRLGINTKFVHIVAPTVWAYKEKRAAACAKLFDHMCVLLPFEPPYFEKVGLPTTFIGHPTVAADRSKGNGEAFRKKHHISYGHKVIALLPGSRENEVRRHMNIMRQVIDQVATQHPKPILVSSAPKHIQPILRDYFASSPYRNILLFNSEDKMDAFAAADVALVKSGTVSLEMAYAGTPMVVMYKVNALSAMIIKKLVKVKYVSLVNLLLDKPVIPEFLQEQATPANISSALLELLNSPDASMQQKRDFLSAIAMLNNNHCAPALKAAQLIGAEAGK